MKYLPQLLAWRFLHSASNEQNVSFMIKICFISIFISTLALTITTAIMDGFEKSTQKKLQNIHSDIIINARGKEIDYSKLKTYINDNFSSIIKEMSPIGIGQILIKNEHNQKTSMVELYGIDLKKESEVTDIKNMIIPSKSKDIIWNSLKNNGSIIIGKVLSDYLNIKPNNNVTLLIPSELQGSTNKINFDSIEAKIAGLFKTGLEEIDEHSAYSSLKTFNEIFSTGITQINIKLKDNINHAKALNLLKSKLSSLNIYSWKELYPSLMSALILQKYVMIAILLLITFIASMNIISLLSMYITQKQKDIAILKSMGMSYNSLLYTFILFSLGISGIASFLGILLGAIISLIIEKYHFIKLPDVYYVSYLPSSFNIYLAIKLFILVLIISLLSSWFAIKKIKNQKTVDLLKKL